MAIGKIDCQCASSNRASFSLRHKQRNEHDRKNRKILFADQTVHIDPHHRKHLECQWTYTFHIGQPQILDVAQLAPGIHPESCFGIFIERKPDNSMRSGVDPSAKSLICKENF